MKRTFILALIMAMVLVCSMQANAALELRGTDNLGNRLIYDSDLNITWYDYTNSGNTWLNQMTWASGLSVSGGNLVGVYDDWRLPSTTQPDSSCGTQYNPGGGFPIQGSGFNCTGSEMGHLFYTELGNVASSGLGNTGDFQNLQWPATFYWTGTAYAPFSNLNAWYFNIFNGYQGNGPKGDGYYAIAVRPGDVSVAVVPEPVSSILFVVGVASLGIRRFRRNSNHKSIYGGSVL